MNCPSVTCKKTKLVMTYRDPKGAAISQYHFYRKHPTLGVSDHLPLNRFVDYFLDGDLYFGDYHEHVAGYFQPEVHGIDPHQILHLRFEDLVERKIRSVRTLSRFLLGRIPARGVRAIADNTEFNTMKAAIQQNPGSFTSTPTAFSGRAEPTIGPNSSAPRTSPESTPRHNESGVPWTLSHLGLILHPPRRPGRMTQDLHPTLDTSARFWTATCGSSAMVT